MFHMKPDFLIIKECYSTKLNIFENDAQNLQLLLAATVVKLYKIIVQYLQFMQ